MLNRTVFWFVIVLCLSGCAKNFNSNNYNSASVGSVGMAIEGEVINLRVVNIEGDEGSTGGAFAGAVLGGVAGNAIGGGRARPITTVLGALAGGAAGSAVGEHMSQQNAMEYTMRADSGKIYTVVQGMDTQFSVGQRVRLVVYSGRKARNRMVAA